MPRQLRVFLCHASQDKPAVWKLHRYLKQHGVSPWLDQADLLPGQNWEVEIPKALFNSDVILVCLSKNSVNKEGYVQKEILFALDKAMEKPEGTIFIIPVKLEECEVPKRLSPYQWVDYFRADGRKRLLMGLNVRVQGLDEDVSPVIMEDSRQKTPRPQFSQPEIAKGPKKDASPVASVEKEVVNKPIQRKPFTKVLDPSSLTPSKVPSALKKNQLLSKSNPKRSFPWNAILLIALSLLIPIIYRLSLLYNQTTGTISTPIPSEATSTIKLPTGTSMSFTPFPQQTNTPISAPTLDIGSTMISEKDGMVMVYVPAGEFTMGSNYGNDNEKPENQVILEAFWIDQTEVTNTMYAQCVKHGDCKPPLHTNSFSRNSYYGNSEFDNYPVIYVDWNQANDYCSWVGRKLPSEAEWEKAARGTDGRRYPWGEEIDCDKANYLGCIGDTAKVGNYLDGTSVYGVKDMASNVWEWVRSLYQTYPYDATDGREDLTASGKRVLRGGSWSFEVYYARSTYRNWNDPLITDYDIGFRCSMDANP